MGLRVCTMPTVANLTTLTFFPSWICGHGQLLLNLVIQSVSVLDKSKRLLTSLARPDNGGGLVGTK
jgi:hypothetical protein